MTKLTLISRCNWIRDDGLAVMEFSGYVEGKPISSIRVKLQGKSGIILGADYIMTLVNVEVKDGVILAGYSKIKQI